MDKVIIGSMRKSAGKTSIIVGIAGALKKKMAYLKPFGERLLYRKKRLWDYDSALITHIFGLQEDPVDMSIGFDHSKLRYMYDEKGIQQKLRETMAHIGNDKEILFIEGGKDLTYGVSIYLDTLSFKTTEREIIETFVEYALKNEIGRASCRERVYRLV
jgi:hypothetical protein